MTDHLLDTLAEMQGTFISNLRLLPDCRKDAIWWMYGLTNEERSVIPIADWAETLFYLTGCRVPIRSYKDLSNALSKLYHAQNAPTQKERI